MYKFLNRLHKSSSAILGFIFLSVLTFFLGKAISCGGWIMWVAIVVAGVIGLVIGFFYFVLKNTNVQ